MKIESTFWLELSELIQASSSMLDRPGWSPHPDYMDMTYILDYGCLENITAGEGDGIHIWIGSKIEKTLTGILCMFDKIAECRATFKIEFYVFACKS